MKILVACECSGRTRDAFTARGHNAVSCDILPSESDLGEHYQGDVMDIINDDWDLMIAHPPCTYLTCAGEWAFSENITKALKPGTLTGKNRLAAREEAVRFFMSLINAPIDKICVENPIGIMSSRYRKPDQYIQPHEFGHNASKKTCLWLKNLPLLRTTEHVSPRIVNGKSRWGNQTDGGQNKLPPSNDRARIRSLTYQGWADAFASQWGRTKL